MTKLAFTATTKPRDVSERVFLDKWQQLMKKEDLFINDIQRSHREPITQKDATLCTNFIMWLGTPVGNGFLELAKELTNHFTSPNDAYVAAWATKNVRRYWCSNGMRLAEYIAGRGGDPKDDLTASDFEVIEACVDWLGTAPGAQFLSDVELTIRRETEVDTLKRRAKIEDAKPSSRKTI